MIRFPYGMADFHALMTEGYVYLDRTDKIRVIEDIGKTLLFLRPRRFGKSLLLSTLENYYDVKRANEFEQLFGHLAIGKDPTPNHNQYFILKWNFSTIVTTDDEFAIQQKVYDHINDAIKECIRWYEPWIPHKIEINPQNALSSFHDLLSSIQTTSHKVYLLIDEYDNFANAVLMSGHPTAQKRYEALIEGEGLLKTVFKTIKFALEGHGLDRVFITGISPVVMSDVTSSFNIVENITLVPELNDVCGFRTDEVVALVQQVSHQCGLSEEQTCNALDTMRTFYNGYSFKADQPPVLYNPTLVLYFLKSLVRTCLVPSEMLDENLHMDRLKLEYIASVVQGKEVICQALNEEKPLIIDRLSNRFGVRDLLNENQQVSSLISLLYYFGVLTLTGTLTELGELILTIPNLVTKQLYVERIRESLLPVLERDQAHLVAREFYKTGDIAGVCEFIEQKYFPLFDNRDYRWTNELTIKTLFMTVLFNELAYVMDSETSLHREYSDLTMIVRLEKRHLAFLDFLFEFKYVSLKELGMSREEIRDLSREQLTILPPIKTQLSRAHSKLTGYRQTLQSTYGGKLRLHSLSVVSVGYERLVWEKVQ